MSIEKKLKRIEKEANKILQKMYKEPTFVAMDTLEIDFSLDTYVVSVRAGIVDKDTGHVHRQAMVETTLWFDCYNIKQLAALIADQLMITLDK